MILFCFLFCPFLHKRIHTPLDSRLPSLYDGLGRLAMEKHNNKEVIKKVNNYLLQKYPYCYLETKNIFVYLPDRKKEKDFTTEVTYLKKYENIDKNSLATTKLSKSYSEKLYIFTKKAISKFKSVIDLGENFEDFLKEIEKFLSDIFIPQDQSKGYFGRYYLSSYVDFDDYSVSAYSIFYEDDVFKFFESAFSKYALKKDPKIEIINYLVITSHPLLSKRNNENIYYAKLSFSIQLSLKEIL